MMLLLCPGDDPTVTSSYAIVAHTLFTLSQVTPSTIITLVPLCC